MRFGLVDRDTALYSGAFDHELRDNEYRQRVLETLMACSPGEDKEALFLVVSYRKDGKPWPDLKDYYFAAAKDASLPPQIRYDVISALAAEGSPNQYALLREVFLEEVHRPSAHLSIAREALVGLSRSGLASLGADPTLEVAAVGFVRLVSTDADYQDQLAGILRTMRPLMSHGLQERLLSLAAELEKQYSDSAGQIRNALR